MSVAIDIVPAHAPPWLEPARALILEYAASLGVDLGYQGFEAEIAGLPGAYAPPRGRLLVALVDREPGGCIGLRRLDEGAAEMKRLYVRPECRGLGLAGALCDALLCAARAERYRRVRLDTLPAMGSAQRLYAGLGFRDVPPYYESPVVGTRFMELEL